MNKQINLIVVGAGEYMYRHLFPALQRKDPCLDMRIAAIIDIVPKEELALATQRIIAENDIPYIQKTSHKMPKLPSVLDTAGVVTTPNKSHLLYADFFSYLAIPVWVEKPVCCSRTALEQFLQISARRPNHIYGANYSVDGKAFGLLWAAGSVSAKDPRTKYLVTKPRGIRQEEVTRLVQGLGSLRKIRGMILEGTDTERTLDHRQWLLDGRQGGMIRDLSPHLFGPLYDIGWASAEVVMQKVEMFQFRSGDTFSTAARLQDKKCGETYAVIRGKFFAPHGNPEFIFEVGKYQSQHHRALNMEYDNGTIHLSYEEPSECYIRTRTDKVDIEIHADPTVLSLLDFKEFLCGNTHGHIGRAAATVRFNESARELGCASL